MLKTVAAAGAILATGLLIFLLSKVAGGGAQVQSGRIVLRYGRGFRAIGLMGAVIALVVAAIFLILLLTGGLTDSAIKGVSVLMVVFLGPAVPLLIEGYRRQVILDDNGISARGWWGSAGEFAWEEITKVEWSQMGEKYIVRAGKKKIVLGGYLEGLGAFEQLCVAKLDPEVYGNMFGGPQPTKSSESSVARPQVENDDDPPPTDLRDTR